MSKSWSQNCDNCGRKYVSRQCKLACENCGARLDCSDLFIDWQQVQATQLDIAQRHTQSPEVED